MKLAIKRIKINKMKNIFSSDKVETSSDATETNMHLLIFSSPLIKERIVFAKTMQRKISRLPLQPFDVPKIPPI